MLKHKLNQDEAKQLLGNIHIPPQPEIVLAFGHERAKDQPDIQRLADLFSKDVGLSAAVLKAVNAPFYGLSTKISSIKHAISMLGMGNVSSLVINLALRASVPIPGIERYWESASRSAQLASMLARKLSLRHLIEDAYLYTLFHDSAMPLLVQRFPAYREVMKKISQGKIDWMETTTMEDAQFNTNHSIVGGLLASNWGLPSHIRDAIDWHHDISAFHSKNLSPDSITLIALGHVAEHIESAISQRMNDCDWCEFGQSCRDHLLIGDEELIEVSDSAKDLFGIDEY
jgi:HD-like signal output (HDOD) protein